MAAAPRTRAVQMPGEIAPQDNPETGVDAGATDAGDQATGAAAVVATLAGMPSIEELMAAFQQQQKQIAELQSQLKAKADAPASMPAALPSVDQVLEKAPAVPVLTRDGWFVPESGPLNPKRDRL